MKKGIPCEWNNVKYSSIAAASRANNVSPGTMKRMLASGFRKDADIKSFDSNHKMYSPPLLQSYETLQDIIIESSKEYEKKLSDKDDEISRLKFQLAKHERDSDSMGMSLSSQRQILSNYKRWLQTVENSFTDNDVELGHQVELELALRGCIRMLEKIIEANEFLNSFAA